MLPDAFRRLFLVLVFVRTCMIQAKGATLEEPLSLLGKAFVKM